MTSRGNKVEYSLGIKLSGIPANNDVLQWDSTTSLWACKSFSELGFYIEGGTDVPVTDGGTGASDAATARTNIGAGTVSTQDSDAVAFTGGSITGVTLSAVGVSTDDGDMTLTSLTTGNAQITGGAISGITDLPVASGGTGASTLTGIIKGNGTSAFTAATGGTDYYRTSDTIPVADGGTNVTSLVARTPLCGGTTAAGDIQSVAALGTSSHTLTSNGASSLPSYANTTITPAKDVEDVSALETGYNHSDFTSTQYKHFNTQEANPYYISVLIDSNSTAVYHSIYGPNASIKDTTAKTEMRLTRTEENKLIHSPTSDTETAASGEILSFNMAASNSNFFIFNILYLDEAGVLQKSTGASVADTGTSDEINIQVTPGTLSAMATDQFRFKA